MHAGMMELADMRDLGSRAERRAGSTPVTRTTSERTTYRSLRLFSKARAHSFRRSSFSAATRFAGLAAEEYQSSHLARFTAPIQSGLHIVRADFYTYYITLGDAYGKHY